MNDHPLIHTRIGGSHFDPSFKIGNDVRGEFAFGWHPIIAVVDRMPQRTAVQVPWDDRRAGFPTGQQSFAILDRESASDRLLAGRMATVAMLDQDRADFSLEEVELIGCKFTIVLGSGRKCRRTADPQDRNQASHGVADL